MRCKRTCLVVDLRNGEKLAHLPDLCRKVDLGHKERFRCPLNRIHYSRTIASSSDFFTSGAPYHLVTSYLPSRQKGSLATILAVNL
ncbi:MAG: hypothetical protein ACJ8CB_09370 [Ktedonobacteraceae bacterium]|jgi:hypothetical protein